MPFQKGNQLGKINSKRKGPRKKMFKEVSEQLISLSPEYNELLVRLMMGESISETQEKGMDRFEKMFEFARPKLARTETKLDQKVTYTQYDNKPDSELEEELNRLSAALSRKEQEKVKR